jgi:ABC-type glycerol-3-phosphate transport system substrate-binding protein
VAVSLEMWKFAEAEFFQSNEGSMCAVAKRDGVAPPGSWAASCLEGHRKPIPAPLGVAAAVIPKGATNIDVAKDFMKYMIQPQVTNNYLKEGLGRFLPAVPSLVKSDPFWLGHPQRRAYTTEALVTDTVLNYAVFNPGWAEVNAQQVWGLAEADVIRNGIGGWQSP